MKVDIGIIGALDVEVDGLIHRLGDYASEKVGAVIIHTGIIGEKKVAVASCGVGKVSAAICAQAMMLKYRPSLLVNTGIAGAIGKGLKIGDTVIADRLCYHDMDTTAFGDPLGLVSLPTPYENRIFFDADERAIEVLKSASASLSLTAVVGTVASGDRFVAGKKDKQSIASHFGAIACEMEGAAIAHTAYLNGTPFAVIRAMSDSADGNAAEDYPAFKALAAERSLALTLALIKEY